MEAFIMFAIRAAVSATQLAALSYLDILVKNHCLKSLSAAA